MEENSCFAWSLPHSSLDLVQPQSHVAAVLVRVNSAFDVRRAHNKDVRPLPVGTRCLTRARRHVARPAPDGQCARGTKPTRALPDSHAPQIRKFPATRCAEFIVQPSAEFYFFLCRTMPALVARWHASLPCQGYPNFQGANSRPLSYHRKLIGQKFE